MRDKNTAVRFQDPGVIWICHFVLFITLAYMSLLFNIDDILAATHNYRTVRIGDPEVVVVRNIDLGTNYSSLDTARTSDAWGPGDTIWLEPGQTDEFPGRVILNTNGQQIYYNGNITSANITGNQNATLWVQNNCYVNGPGYVKNTNTTSSAARAIMVDCNTANITDFRISDIEVLQQTPINNISPIVVTNTGVHGTTANMASGAFVRCKFNLGGGYRDVWLNDAKSAQGRSQIWLIDCEFSGATSTAGGSGGVSNNVVSVDGDADVFVVGGKFHTSGGSVLDITDTLGSSLWVIGAEIWNGGAIPGAGTEHHGGVYANAVINCYIHDCWSGIKLIEGNGKFATVSSSVAFPSGTGNTYAIGNRVIRDPVRNPPTISSVTAGIKVSSDNAVVENNLIKGWDWVSTNAAAYDAGLAVPGHNASVVVRETTILKCHRGIESSGRSGVSLDLYDVVVQSEARTNPGGSAVAPAALWFTGLTGNIAAVRWNNCTFMSEPVDDTWLAGNNYVIQLSTGTSTFADFRGGSTIYRNSNVTSGFNVGAPAATDLNTTGLANRPIIDEWGRIAAESPNANQGQLNPWNLMGEPWYVDAGDLSTNRAGASNYWPTSSTVTIANLRTPVAVGTAQAIGSTTIRLAAGDGAANDAYNGWWCYITSASSGANQRQRIQDFNSTTKDCTLIAAWPSGTPTGTVTYAIERPLQGMTALFPEYSSSPTNTNEIAGQYRLIHDSTPTTAAGVTTLTLRPGIRTTTAAYVAVQGTVCVILPPAIPFGGNISRMDGSFMESRLAFAGTPMRTDMYGRTRAPDWLSAAARARPCPFTEMPRRHDYRRIYDPGISGRNLRVDDVIPEGRSSP